MMNTITFKKMLGIIGALVLLNGVFLPWVTFRSIIDYNILKLGRFADVLYEYPYLQFAQYLSYVLVALAVVTILLIALDKPKLAAGSALLALLFSGAVLLLMHQFTVDVGELSAADILRLFDSTVYDKLEVGYGIYMCIIGSLVSFIGMLLEYKMPVPKGESS